MDQESIVYGCIKDYVGDANESERRNCNRHAMMNLPKAEDWPYISREMFAVPETKIQSGGYLTEVMHFGASYKAVEYEWNAWLNHFEQLLDKMYWVSAVVHLETELYGIHTFNWSSRLDHHAPGSGLQMIHCEWTQDKGLL